MKVFQIVEPATQAAQIRRAGSQQLENAISQSKSIISNVASKGDSALLDYTEKFDGVRLRSLRVSDEEIEEAKKMVTSAQVKAIRLMKHRLESSERVLFRKLRNVTYSDGGTRVERMMRPIRSVGCYVPGGKARYPSTLVMCTVPAKVAGVKRIVTVSPPGKDGSIDPLTLVASEVCGVDEIYKIGGAQAVAALAYGTETIRPVSKIVGPGGVIVTAAKLAISERVSIDMVAGPTELLIFADESANPDFVALDLVSQSEHSADTICGLVCTSERLASQVSRRVESIISKVARGEIVRNSLKDNGFIAVCKCGSDAIDFINEFAPEHLELVCRDSKTVANGVYSAGVVLLGESVPSSASDYCLGSNHVLPTGGFGSSRGALSVLDFLKMVTTVRVTSAGLKRVANSILAMTEAEGLPNHYEAVRARIYEG